MRIRKVDFDERLINAQRDNSLVVFAGAGVSMGPPSNYPSFNGLTQDIAKWASQEWREREPNEHFLGRLDRQGIKVHERVVDLLSSPESSPKPVHEDLLKLFGGWTEVRVVTTNFDCHFETAAKAVFGQNLPEVFRAPTLPLGSDFAGIVYLHGSVFGEPRRLVLSDRDFGRAYLTEGWATRFLQAMFFHYTVLFVGYSHNDTVMHYLSRALPPENTKPRFALVRADENPENWQYRGIKPLSFPFEDEKDYSQLGTAIAGWVEWAQRGVLDTEQRIKELVERPPPLDEESQDFLLWAINDSVAVRFFVRHAKKPEWLVWVSERKLLEPLFADGDLSPGARELALWVAATYSVEHSDTVFGVLERHDKALNQWFTYEIARQLACGKPVPNRDVISRWVPLLVQNQIVGDQHELNVSLERALAQDALSAVIQLFEHLTRPRLHMRKAIMWSQEGADARSKTDAELRFHGKHSLLQPIWEKKVKPRLAELAAGLWPVVVQNLNLAFHLTNSWGKAGSTWDPMSWQRAAVEPHEQDKYRHPEDILINAARDCLEWGFKEIPVVAIAWTESISQMEPLLLRRLAIHGISSASEMDHNEKIRWLLSKDFMVASGLKHEVYQLLRKTYPGTDRESRRALLDAMLSQLDALGEMKGYDNQRKDYHAFGLLDWLSQADPSCEEVATRLVRLRETHPDFERRRYPDLDRWVSSSGFVGPRSPLSMEELLEKRPSDWIEYLETFKGERFEGPDREGLLRLVSRAVQQDFNWGKELAEVLSGRPKPPQDLWESVIWGWRGADLLEEQWEYVLTVLDDDMLVRRHSQGISDLLQEGVKKEEGGIPLRLFNKADQVADKIWKNHDDDEQDSANDRWNRAITHPGGILAMFWLHALSRTRKETGKKREGLIQPYRERFERIVAGKSEIAVLGRVVLASELAFLFTVNEDWARANLIPLLDWEQDILKASQSWAGWLNSNRLIEPLLSELIPHYRKAFSLLASELNPVRNLMVEHVVFICIFGMNDPLGNGWLADFLNSAETEDRTSFASQFGQSLMNMQDDTKKALWNRWLREYWERRNQGVPVPLSNAELVEMVEWAGELEPVFPEVVEVVCAGRVPHMEHSSLFYFFTKEKRHIVSHYPDAMAKFLIHLASDDNMQRHFCHDLEILTDQLIAAGVPSALLRKLCDRLAAVGCSKAAELCRRIV